jgi:hypothetical protein
LCHFNGAFEPHCFAQAQRSQALITDGKTYEVNVMEDLALEPGAFYLIDQGYLDFARLFVIHEA